MIIIKLWHTVFIKLLYCSRLDQRLPLFLLQHNQCMCCFALLSLTELNTCITMHCLWKFCGLGTSPSNLSLGCSLAAIANFASTMRFTLSWSPWHIILKGAPLCLDGTYLWRYFMISITPLQDDGFSFITPRLTYQIKKMIMIIYYCHQQFWSSTIIKGKLILFQTRNVCITKYARLYKLSNSIMVLIPK